jgi:hypothetical protein
MARRLENWLSSYLDYTSGTEAPKMMHFYVGISTIAGALRKHVWLDMVRFKWTPNFYIILVAPPGIISKTTTMDYGMELLKAVPGIRFGPDVITWQALVKKFAESFEEFEYGDVYIPQSALNLASGELGNLINPIDKDMVNLYISLWDGRAGFEKETKVSGNDSVNSPWINMVGCTTPHWIADNFPASMIGGGFTSRCIFVYGDKKERLVAWPDEHVRTDHSNLREALVADLEHIATNLVGPMTLTPEARAWGQRWYENLWNKVAPAAASSQVQGYLARKQGHLVKLGMILSVSGSDDLVVTDRHLELAEAMLSEAEKTSSHVFSKIGRTEQANDLDLLSEFIRRHVAVSYAATLRHVIASFPSARGFEDALAALIRSGQVKLDMSGGTDITKATLVWVAPNN